ncbi:hypothetical protein ACFQ3R_10675 [Mesonia ostreae]|uniref:Uncharacterized protein n=1 Tax=Mesonia ostreae TaxID=861110 RepID=A0ABU2KGQ8_9FLAO|nr:hypothetical protein [Mesonia ostreae]MDT0293843.1 hypothetical protein [Mesonia ostreae]
MMNKKFLFLPVVLMTILFSSCSDDDDVVDRLRTIDDIPVSVEETVSYLPINVFDFPIETDVDLRGAIEDELGTDEALDQVDEIELDNMALELVSADDQENFDFIDSVTISVRTNGLDIKQVASLDNVPEGATRIELNTTDDFVDEYAKSDDLKLIIQFTSTEDANNITVKMDMEFDAKLDPSL